MGTSHRRVPCVLTTVIHMGPIMGPDMHEARVLALNFVQAPRHANIGTQYKITL
jgi:hypothetical protein